MKHLLFSITIFAISLSYDLKAQGILVKTDGTLISFSNIKLKNDQIRLNPPGTGDKLDINRSDFECYFSLDERSTYYLKPTLNGNNITGYSFQTPKVAGRIKVYESLTQGYPNSNAYSIHLYAEKDNKYLYVFNSNLIGNKKDQLANLKSLIDDDAVVKQIMESDTWQYKYDEVMKLIKAYNLNALKTNNLSTDSAKVIFYRVKSKQHKQAINVEIGEATYSLNRNDIGSFFVPYENEIKVCFRNETEEVCEVIQASKYYDSYYLVDYRKSGEVTLVKENKKAADFNLEIINFNRNKN